MTSALSKVKNNNHQTGTMFAQRHKSTDRAFENRGAAASLMQKRLGMLADQTYQGHANSHEDLKSNISKGSSSYVLDMYQQNF